MTINSENNEKFEEVENFEDEFQTVEISQRSCNKERKGLQIPIIFEGLRHKNESPRKICMNAVEMNRRDKKQQSGTESRLAEEEEHHEEKDCYKKELRRQDLRIFQRKNLGTQKTKSSNIPNLMK